MTILEETGVVKKFKSLIVPIFPKKTSAEFFKGSDYT